MAASGYTPIQLYYSSTTTNVPVNTNLANGELAINITDGKLFYKDNSNVVQVIGWKTTPASAGGTGQTTYAVGDLLYASTTTALSKLADVATGNALISGGVGIAPSYGKIGLTTHVSGTLPIANGGTALTTTPTNGQLLIGNGTNYTLAAITAGTGITVTNASGSITIAASGSVSAATPTALGTVYGSQTSGGGTPYLTAYGYNAGLNNTGAGNTAVGSGALTANTSGSQNVAVGYNSLAANTTTAYSTAVGYAALNANTVSGSTAVGWAALYVNTSGANNTAMGYSALIANTTGPQNTAVGAYALTGNTTGGYNIAIGYQALNANTVNYENIAVGLQSLYFNTGQNNTAIGSQALRANTTGNNNTSVGASAGYSNTATGSTYIGYRAGYYVTTGSNLGIGYQAIFGDTGGATGYGNVGIGDQVLTSLTTATYNTIVGQLAGYGVTTGSQNILLGYQAGNITNILTTGSNNIVIGYNAYSSSATVSNEVTLGNTSITSTRLRGMVALNMAMFEQATISATAATGTINYDAQTQSVLYYTSNASANWTLNIRASGSTSLNTAMATGQSMTVAFLVTNGATAYYQSALTVDGTSVTPKWQGGTAPTSGNASSVDIYVITIIKTGSAAFSAFASQTKFA